MVQGCYQDAKTHILEEMLENKWGKVLCVDQQGLVTFVRKSMGYFFSMFPICGIDTTHELMANACLRKFELITVLSEMEGITDGNACNVPCTASDLSLYAAEHWSTHYSLAQESSPALSERLHKLLWVQLRKAFHPSPPDQEYQPVPCSFPCDDCARYAFSYCQERGFVVLRDAYAQMRITSPAVTPVYGTARSRPKLEYEVRGLVKSLSQYHIATTTEHKLGCFNPLSSPGWRERCSWDADWDSVETESAATDSEWLFVELGK